MSIPCDLNGVLHHQELPLHPLRHGGPHHHPLHEEEEEAEEEEEEKELQEVQGARCKVEGVYGIK